MRRPDYEVDETTFPAEAYKVAGYDGVAWRVYGWEIERFWDESEDIPWDEPESRRTGRVVCVMVGDDQRFTFDPNELTPIPDLDYCAACGQIGCQHDGRERE